MKLADNRTVKTIALEKRPDTGAALLRGIHPCGEDVDSAAAAYLIERYSDPGELVLDPNMGCGAALAEAVFLGRSACGIGGNPLEELIARVRLNPLTGDILRAELARFPEHAVSPMELKRSIDTITDGGIANFFRVCASEAMESGSIGKFRAVCDKNAGILDHAYQDAQVSPDFQHYAHVTEIGLISADMILFPYMARTRADGDGFDALTLLWPEWKSGFRDEATYLDEVVRNFTELERVLRPGGFFCVIRSPGGDDALPFEFGENFTRTRTFLLTCPGGNDLRVTVSEKIHK
ncbi:MAG: hypothetical protein HPY53_03460 [Brevinematales bacterium]|nr:hypothetical protein [Brevinematales bacterium]